MRVWLVLLIGCIECGDSNTEPVLGVYASREKADAKIAETRAAYERDGRRFWDVETGFNGSGSQVRLVEVEIE